MTVIRHLHRTSLRPHAPSHAPAMVISLLACAACAALLALSACGVTTGTGASPSATRTTSPAQSLTVHATVRPCTGPFAAAGAQAPTLVLTPQTPHESGAARVGEVAQVRLPITHAWKLASVPTGLRLLGPASQQDAQLDVCFWSFKLDKAGTFVLSFTGLTPCDPSVATCQPTSATERFTLTVR